MTTIKKAIISIVLLVLLIGGAGFYYLDTLVERGIEVAGSQVLGTSVTVSSTSLTPFNGNGSIEGLNIENPEGYKSQYAFQLSGVAVDMDVNTLLDDVIVINSIVIDQPQITYETKISTDNIRALMGNLPGGSSAPTSSSDTSAEGPKIIIRDLRINAPQLNLVADVVAAPIAMGDIHLTDIGTAGNAVSTSEAVSTILAALTRSIGTVKLPSMDEITDSARDALQNGLNSLIR